MAEAKDLTKHIRSSNKCTILVHGVNEQGQALEQNVHHLSLLGGILGKNISAENRLAQSFSLRKNSVTAEVHIGSHPECRISHEEVDLLLVFIPLVERRVDLRAADKLIKEITQARRAMIWKHAVFVLTGTDAVADNAQKFPIKIETWTDEIMAYIKEAVGNMNDNIPDQMILLTPTGKPDNPDLPGLPNWLSVLWYVSFFCSKPKAMPALLKICQERITYYIKPSEQKSKPFHSQPIKVDKVSWSFSVRKGLGIAGAGTAAVTGATIGALIGALAIGVPSFGIAAGTGLVLGAVIGGAAGTGAAVGIGAAVGGEEKDVSTSIREHMVEVLTNLPEILTGFKTWIGIGFWKEKPHDIKIVVTGIEGEGVTTATRSLTGHKTEHPTRQYWLKVLDIAQMNTYEGPVFPKLCNMQQKAKEVVAYKDNRVWSAHLLVFCIPMMSVKDVHFHESAYIEALKHLGIEDPTILSNTVIALTHANEMRPHKPAQPQATFKEFFESELATCQEKIARGLHINLRLDEKTAKAIPVVAVGKDDTAIDLSEAGDGQPAQEDQFWWVTEFLLQAMIASKPPGVPTLIRRIRKRMAERPHIFRDCDEARKLLIETQCNTFSTMGKLYYEHRSGESIGLIAGTNEELKWL